MKKIIISFLLIITAVTGLNASSYKDATMTREAFKTLGKLNLKKDFVKVYVSSGSYYTMRYNSKTMNFLDLYNVNIDEIKGSDLFLGRNTDSDKMFPKFGHFIQINSNSHNEDGDCESFVKAFSTLTTNNRDTAIHGKRLSPTINIKSGTVIVTRTKGTKAGHIAIILSVKKDYIWIINQNAHYHVDGENQGIVSINKVYFGKKITDKKSKNYYIVKIKK